MIVTAFNRKEFLLSAIYSVLNQTLDKSKYEIIVLKNFQDEKIDGIIKGMNGVSLRLGTEIIGSYLFAGIERSSGDIIVFLDDDDEFMKDKLQTIYEVFSSSPEIGYYHNDRIIIDASGNEILTSFRRFETDFIQKTGHFIVEKPVTEKYANMLFNAGAYGYMSSIAVKKSVVVPLLTQLKTSIASVQDIFFFYCALLSTECRIIAVDSKKLTKYRLHPANVSQFSYAIDNQTELEKKIFEFLLREKKSLDAIMEIATGRENMEQEKSLKVVRKMIGYDLYLRKVNLNMVDPSSNRRRVISDAITFFRYSFRSRFIGQVNIVVRSVLWVIFPNTTKRIFVKRFAKR